MATAGSVVIDILARTGSFETDMARAEKLMKQRMKAIEESVNSAASAIAVGGVAIAGGMMLWVKQAADAADQLDQLSERTGVAVETLNGLTYATRMSGGDIGELEKGLQSLNKQLSSVAAGDKSAKDMFKALGITATDAEGALMQLADVFPALSKQDQVRLGTELLGKSYQSLVPLLAQGRDGLQALIEEGQALNPITAETAAQAALFNDNMGRLKALSDSAAISLGNTLIPKLNELTQEFILGLKHSDGFFDALMKYGLTNPFNTLEGNLTRITAEYESLDFKLSNGRSTDEAADRKKLRSLGQQLEYYRAIKAAQDGSVKPSPAADKTKKSTDKTKKNAAYTDPLADEAKAYAAAMDAINKAQLSAQTSGMELTATQQRLVDLFASPEWLTMPDTWKQAVAQQAEVSIAAEQHNKQMQDYLGLVRELNTEEERRAEKLRESLKIIDAMQQISQDERSAVVSKAIDAATSEAPQYAGLAPEVGGAFSEFKRIDDAQAKLEEWYQKQLEMLAKFREERNDLAEQFNAEEVRINEQHRRQLEAIDQARTYTQLSAAENAFGTLTDMARQYAGEQSEIYRIAFAMEKAAAIARSVIAIQQGIAMASANPWPMNLAAMASVAAATASIVSNISAVAMPNVGARFSGGPVSADMPYLIGERGPELFVPNTAGRVLPNSSLGGNSSPTINLIEDRRRAGQTQQRNTNGRDEIDVFVADILGDGPRSKAVQKAFGLQRRGY